MLIVCSLYTKSISLSVCYHQCFLSVGLDKVVIEKFLNCFAYVSWQLRLVYLWLYVFGLELAKCEPVTPRNKVLVYLRLLFLVYLSGFSR